MVAGLTSTVFINEFHYDNNGTDSGEFIEIANTNGTDLTGWSVVLYSGVSTQVYGTYSLSGTGQLQVINLPVNGLQNGPKDGIALVNASNVVVQFLSYEGVLTATGGVASGLTSTDILVSENGSTPVGYSLQLVGTGSTYGDFMWNAVAITATKGASNTSQTITAASTRIEGSSAGETLTGGNSSADTIIAQGGNDIVNGNGMNDFVLGNKGADTLNGGDGNDTLYGGVGNDILNGGNGDDRLYGDKHDDQLTGGAGADVFGFKAKFGHDVITDFELGIDTVEFRSGVFASFSALSAAMVQSGADVVITDAKGNTLTIQDVLVAELTADHFLFV